jgi:hypothetical protein
LTLDLLEEQQTEELVKALVDYCQGLEKQGSLARCCSFPLKMLNCSQKREATDVGKSGISTYRIEAKDTIRVLGGNMLSKEKSEKSIEGITVVNLPAGELNGLFAFYSMGERKEKVKIPLSSP